MSTTPTQRDLQRHVTPQYAADWREIGVELGLTDAKLREIEAGNPTNLKWCCNRVFSEWLRMDTTASWEKLFAAIESPAVSGGPVRGNYHVLCVVTIRDSPIMLLNSYHVQHYLSVVLLTNVYFMGK